MIKKPITPFQILTGSKLWLDDPASSIVAKSYQALSTITGSGSFGTKSITASASVADTMFIGSKFRIGASDIYTVANIATTTITTVETLSTNYTTQQLYTEKVAQENDKSGFGNNSANGTVDNQPTFVLNAQNSRSGLGFDAGNDLLTVVSSSSIDDIFIGGGTIAFVFKPRGVGGAGNGRVFEKVYNVITQSGLKLLFGQPTSGTQAQWSTDNLFTTNSAYIVIITYNSSNLNTAPKIYVNNTSATNLTQTFTGIGSATTDSSVNMVIGNRAAGDRAYDGYLLEPLTMWNKVLSSSEINQYMRSQGYKWGIPVAGIDSGFISLWKTDNAGTSANNQITIPTSATGTYNCTVYWGDGTSSVITSYNDAAWTHTYPTAGNYYVRITGVFNGIQFNNGGDRLKLLNISQWGADFRLGTNQGSYFYGCSNLVVTADDILNLTSTTSLFQAFRNCTALTRLPSASGWNTSGITNLTTAFYMCSNFNEPGLSAWNVSNVTVLGQCFHTCALFNADISGWNTANNTSLNQTFDGCLAFNRDLSNWNVAKVTNMTASFRNTAVNFSLASWDVSKVTAANLTFFGCASFNSPVGNLNWALCTTLAQFFQNCSALNQDFSGWLVTATTNFTSFLGGVTLSNANYNKLLNSWSGQAVQTGVTFSGGNSHYDTTSGGVNGTAGRLVLTGTKSWTIIDGGTP